MGREWMGREWMGREWTIVDHHAAAEQFVNFERLELRNSRPLMADWAWTNPPLSGIATLVFHRHYDDGWPLIFFEQYSPWDSQCLLMPRQAALFIQSIGNRFGFVLTATLESLSSFWGRMRAHLDVVG